MKQKQNLREVLKFALITLSCSLTVNLLFHPEDGNIACPNGYVIRNDKGSACAIVGPYDESRGVIGPEVETYGIEGKYLFGHTVDYGMSSDSGIQPPGQKTGYFILDTSNENAIIGLNENDWLARLGLCGVKNPKLIRTPYEPR